MKTPSRLRALIERWLPWYDPAAELVHDERTEAIRQKSIAARIEAENALRGAYQAVGERLTRR